MSATTSPSSPNPPSTASRKRHNLRRALVAIPLASAGLFGGAAVVPAYAGTAGERPASSLTCRGEGIDPAAKVHHRTETFIKAPMSTIWKLQTDVEGWPSWQTPVTSMKRLTPGPLRAGSQFRWTTPAPATPTTPATTLVITSSVHQIKPNHCIRWSGPAIGDGLRIDEGVHVWEFVKVKGGVIVRTEESWTGGQLEADPATAIKYLAPGLDGWLAELKKAAEARPCHR